MAFISQIVLTYKLVFLWAVDSFHRLVIVRNFSVFTELPPHLSEKDSQLQNSDFFILCVLEMERCEMPLWSHNPDEIFRNRKENRTPPTSQRLKIFRKKLFNAMEGFFVLNIEEGQLEIYKNFPALISIKIYIKILRDNNNIHQDIDE